MEAIDVFFECVNCKKKIGSATMISIGTSHQWIKDAICLECMREKVKENRLEISRERFDKVIAWLES